MPKKYALEVIETYILFGSRPIDFAMEANNKPVLASCPLIEDPTHYNRLVARLVYLTITQPELCYAVHILP